MQTTTKIPETEYPELLEDFRKLAIKFEQGLITYSEYLSTYAIVEAIPYAFFKPDSDDFKQVKKDIINIHREVIQIKRNRTNALKHNHQKEAERGE